MEKMLSSFVGGKKEKTGWGGQNFDVSYTNLDKIKRNHAKKEINFVPKRALASNRWVYNLYFTRKPTKIQCSTHKAAKALRYTLLP